MSSHRRYKTVKKKRGIKINRQSKTNNILMLKLADPIIQCIIFIYFIYCLDSDVIAPSYRTVLLLLVAWQAMSVFANMFYKDNKALRTERLVFLVVDGCYMAVFFLMEKLVIPKKEISFGINELDDHYIHLYQTILMTGALIIAFWYNLICYREVKSLLSGVSQDR